MGKNNSFNSELGSALYRLFSLSLFYVGFKFFGLSVFSALAFFVINEVAYRLVGSLLRSLGVWK